MTRTNMKRIQELTHQLLFVQEYLTYIHLEKQEENKEFSHGEMIVELDFMLNTWDNTKILHLQ